MYLAPLTSKKRKRLHFKEKKKVPSFPEEGGKFFRKAVGPFEKRRSWRVACLGRIGNGARGKGGKRGRSDR